MSSSRREELTRQVLRRHLDVAGVSASRRLRDIVVSGALYGGSYWSEERGAGCVVGWLFAITEATHAPLDVILVRTHMPKKWRTQLVVDDDSLAVEVDPLELYIVDIDVGDTPETSDKVLTLVNWIDEWFRDRKAPMPETKTMTPAEAAFREAVRRVHDRGFIPTPTLVLEELGKPDRAKSRDIGGPLLNGRESAWRVSELKSLGYSKDEWSGRWSLEGQV